MDASIGSHSSSRSLKATWDANVGERVAALGAHAVESRLAPGVVVEPGFMSTSTDYAAAYEYATCSYQPAANCNGECHPWAHALKENCCAHMT